MGLFPAPGDGGRGGGLFEMTLTLIRQSILSFHVAKFCSGQSWVRAGAAGFGPRDGAGGLAAPNCPAFLSKLREGENVKSLNFSPLFLLNPRTNTSLLAGAV